MLFRLFSSGPVWFWWTGASLGLRRYLLLVVEGVANPPLAAAVACGQWKEFRVPGLW